MSSRKGFDMADIFGKKCVSTEELETVYGMEGEANLGISLKYDYAAAIEKELKNMPLMFKSRKDEDETRFEVLMPSERLQVLRVKMIVDEDGDIKLRCYLANSDRYQNHPL